MLGGLGGTVAELRYQWGDAVAEEWQPPQRLVVDALVLHSHSCGGW